MQTSPDNFIESEELLAESQPLPSLETNSATNLNVPSSFQEIGSNLGTFFGSAEGIAVLQGLGLLFVGYLILRYMANSRSKLGKTLKI